jgi:hypothetical protein
VPSLLDAYCARALDHLYARAGHPAEPEHRRVFGEPGRHERALGARELGAVPQRHRGLAVLRPLGGGAHQARGDPQGLGAGQLGQRVRHLARGGACGVVLGQASLDQREQCLGRARGRGGRRHGLRVRHAHRVGDGRALGVGAAA